MLIIEGPDGVGKTTLCRRLLRDLPTHVYAHFTRLPAGFDYHWGYAERMSRHVVQDRFHLSEVVYSRARGEASPLTDEAYRLVDARLRLLGVYMVVVTADPQIVLGRWDESQMYDLERTMAAAAWFREVTKPDHAGSGLGRYDVDFVFHCTAEVPYVTEDAAREVLAGYRARQRLVEATAARRPVGL